MFVLNLKVAEMLMLLNIKLTLTSEPQVCSNFILEPVFLGLVLEIRKCLVIEEGVVGEEIRQALFLMS